MAERVVKVRLSAVVSDYEAGMKRAAEATHAVGTEAEKLAQQKAAFQQLGAVGLTMGAVLSAGLALATKASMDFDAQMSAVQASTHKSAGNMDLLRQAALDAGASTVYSATEAAQAIEELAKAGVTTADILGGGLAGSLDLAAAGGLSVARAAEITATSLNQFGLDGANAAQVADVLAAGAGKAMGSVEDLASGLKFVGPVANSMGVSLEETTGVLALFAQQGIIGEQAGTSLRGVLSSLTSPSAQARSEIERLGITLYDSAGNFLGLQNAAGELSDAYGRMDGASRDASLGVIFGRETVTAATTLYKAGAGGVDQWTTAVDDSGYAAETAAMRLDNLKGDLEALGGVFETALIDTGSPANDTLRTLVQALTGLVGLYNELPGPIQASTMALGAGAAAVALTGGAVFLAIPKWLEFKATVEASTWSMKGIGFAAGGAAAVLGGLFLVVGELAAEHQRAQAKAQNYAATLADGTREITDATRDLIAEGINAKQGAFLWLEGSSMADAANDLGISLDIVRKAIEGDAGALDELNSKTQEAIDGYSAWDNESIRLNSSAEFLRETVEKETGALDQAAEAARNKAEATDESSTSAESAADAYTAEADAVADLNSKLTDLINQINDANGVAVDAITANANYLSALDGLAAQVEKTGTSLDESTVSGSANAAALGDLAEKARDAAEAQFEQDLATMTADEAAKKWNGTLGAQRQAFIDSAMAAGYNAGEVQALADRIFQMPDEKTIDMLVETAQAQNAIDRFVTLNDGRRVKVHVDVEGNQSFNVGGKTVSAFSKGGPVRGPGSTTSDDVPALLSAGEHVLTAQEVAAAGGHEAIEEWRSMLASGRSLYAEPPSYVGSWVSVGAGGGAASPLPAQPLSLDGLSISGQLEIGGDGLARIINGHIHQYDEKNLMATRGGVRR